MNRPSPVGRNLSVSLNRIKDHTLGTSCLIRSLVVVSLSGVFVAVLAACNINLIAGNVLDVRTDVVRWRAAPVCLTPQV